MGRGSRGKAVHGSANGEPGSARDFADRLPGAIGSGQPSDDLLGGVFPKVRRREAGFSASGPPCFRRAEPIQQICKPRPAGARSSAGEGAVRCEQGHACQLTAFGPASPATYEQGLRTAHTPGAQASRLLRESSKLLVLSSWVVPEQAGRLRSRRMGLRQVVSKTSGAGGTPALPAHGPNSACISKAKTGPQVGAFWVPRTCCRRADGGR